MPPPQGFENTMRTRLAGWMLPVLKGLVTIGLFAILARSIDIRRTAEFLGGTSISLFLGACGVMVLQALIAVVRWRQVMLHQRFPLPFGSLTRFFWLGLFFNQVLPSSVGGDAARAYCLVRKGCGIGNASVAVLLDRMCGMVGLVLLVLLSLPFSFQYIGDDATRWGVVLVAVGATGAIFFVLILDRLTARFRRWRIARGMTALSRDARGLLFSSGSGIRLVLLSVAVHLISVAAMAVLAIAAKLDVHWLAFVIVVPLASLLMTVPVSVAGWGVREGVMVVGLGYAGMNAEKAVALSILYGLLLLVVALPGGFVWLLDGRRRAVK